MLPSVSWDMPFVIVKNCGCCGLTGGVSADTNLPKGGAPFRIRFSRIIKFKLLAPDIAF